MRAATALVVILIAGACAGGSSSGSATAGPASPGAAVASAPAPAAAPSSGALASLLSMRLTDVRSGQAFTLADFSGKVVIVEGMAVW